MQYAAQMQSIHTLPHLLGPCHRGQNSLESFPEQSAVAAISNGRLEEEGSMKTCLDNSSKPAAASYDFLFSKLVAAKPTCSVVDIIYYSVVILYFFLKMTKTINELMQHI